MKKKYVYSFVAVCFFVSVFFFSKILVKIESSTVEKISKDQVIQLIKTQAKNKFELNENLTYELVDLDEDAQLEIVILNKKSLHDGYFYIFDLTKEQNYKLIAEKNWNGIKLDFNDYLSVSGKTIFCLTDTSGGSSFSSSTTHFWYIDKGVFVEAWEYVTKNRIATNGVYSLSISSFNFNIENELLYVWSSDYLYDDDGDKLQEPPKTEAKVFEFNGTNFQIRVDTDKI